MKSAVTTLDHEIASDARSDASVRDAIRDDAR